MASVPPVSYSVNKLHTNMLRQQQKARSQSQPSLNETDNSKSAVSRIDFDHSLSVTPQTTPPSSPMTTRLKILGTLKGFYNSFSSSSTAGSSLLGVSQPQDMQKSHIIRSLSCPPAENSVEDIKLNMPTISGNGGKGNKSGANDGSPGPRKG